MPDSLKKCPQCDCPYGYDNGNNTYCCPDCQHEWNPNAVAADDVLQVKDSNGNILQNGDSVIVIKDLPVKGSSNPVKKGTKVKNIKLVEGDHNIDCKIDGFGSMALKSEFVKKA